MRTDVAYRLTTAFFVTVIALLVGSAGLHAQSANNFYKGKTIFMLAGVSGGGDVDFKMRLVARYLGRHIPGNPTVVPQNMVGATGLTMANYLYGVAPQDGTYIGLVQNGLPAYQAVGMPNARFDPAKFNWLGSLAASNEAMAVWNTTGVKSIADAKLKELAIGAVGATGISTSFPRMLNALLGTKFKVIPGYTGAGDANLAMERGELAGRAGPWQAWKTNNPEWIHDHKLVILTYSGPVTPDLAKVPQLLTLLKSQDDRTLVNLVTAGDNFGQPFATGPGVPVDRVRLLRKAMMETMADPDLIKDAKAVRSDVKPIPGEELQTLASSLSTSPANAKERAKHFLLGN